MGRGASRGPPARRARRLPRSASGMDYVDLWQLHAWDDGHAAGGDAWPPATSRCPPAAPATSASATSPAGRRAGVHLAARLAGPHAADQYPGRVLAAAARRRARGRAGRESWGSACWPGRRWAAGCSPGKYRHSTPSESRGASPQWQGFIDGLRSRRPTGSSRRHHRRGWSRHDPLAVALAWVRDGRVSWRRSWGAGRRSSCRRRSMPTACASRGHPDRAGGRLGAALRLSRAPVEQ
jgi:aryl-alcohol dehydrogenase-like predicted oxidoreductase